MPEYILRQIGKETNMDNVIQFKPKEKIYNISYIHNEKLKIISVNASSREEAEEEINNIFLTGIAVDFKP